MIRSETRKIMVGNVQIGGQNKVVIQSMCNTKTKDVNATVKQILQLEKVGCEIIRVACLDIEDAQAIRKIKEKIHIPIVADIHFDYRIALEAIEAGIDKLRINPGNIGSEEKIRAVVDLCKQKNIPIRIGINAGSLEKDLLKKYGTPTVEAMIESAKRHVEILEKMDFYDYLLSLKASNLDMCIESYMEASKQFDCPLHLGITEAGTEFSGTIKSSIGLGYMLREGIGDTIRVSLSDEPVKEIKVAKEILKDCKLYSKSPTLVACPTCGRIQYNMIPIVKEIEEFLQTINLDITVAVMGCAVNGPGEAREADIGIAGGVKEGLLFKNGEIIKKVKQDDIVQCLKEEILKLQAQKTQIIVGKTAGFCYGVQKAVKGCMDIIKEYKKDIYCLNEVVHNPSIIQSLENQGIRFINDLQEANGITIIRAHGISKEVYEKAIKKGIELRDYTCPNVLNVHNIAEQYEKQGYYIMLCGKAKHPEVIGTLSYCGNNVFLITNKDDTYNAIKELQKTNIKKVLLISQTTYSVQQFEAVVEILNKQLPKDIDLEINNTICKGTELRQIETRKIAKKVPYMIIIGGNNSYNTHKLYEIAKSECKNSICIENKDELDLEQIQKYSKIGIMAGSSTPVSSINEVVDLIQGNITKDKII